MADSPASVAINIGSQRIGIAVFETAKNGSLVLKAYDSEAIVADPALDASRVSQTRIAIGDLVKRLKVAKSRARYALSGQAVITRFVKLPPLQGDNIEQLVTFEAQQQFPFPIDTVVWDYELMEGSGEKEVVIVAIKADALDEINSAVNDSGLGTSEVDAAPMALYNAFRASYGEPEESILLIDIGARNTNLLYIDGKRFFTRSIGSGGSTVTSAIAKEYGIPFLEAEHQKISNGLVSLGGGHTEQLDEAIAALAGVIRNALNRLPTEIARTTSLYRREYGGNAPTRILLAGGGANLPYTLEFFQEKLNLPVEYFNPLRSVSIGKNVDPEVIQREAHLMGELVGLGLRGVGKSSINIDLVPGVVEKARAADRRKPFLIGAALVFLAGVAGWAVFQNLAATQAEDKARTMTESVDSLGDPASQIVILLKKEATIRDVATGYTSAEADRTFWYDLIEEVKGAFASDSMWVTDIEPLNGYSPVPTDPKVANGRVVVKPDFATGTNRGSALIDLKPEAAPVVKGRQPAPVSSTVTANAVRIRGFWRENPDSQNLVSKRLKALRDNSESFSFFITGPDKQPLALKDEQILKVTSLATGGELAFPFEITLPLAREVAVK